MEEMEKLFCDSRSDSCNVIENDAMKESSS